MTDTDLTDGAAYFALAKFPIDTPSFLAWAASCAYDLEEPAQSFATPLSKCPSLVMWFGPVRRPTMPPTSAIRLAWLSVVSM